MEVHFFDTLLQMLFNTTLFCVEPLLIQVANAADLTEKSLNVDMPKIEKGFKCQCLMSNARQRFTLCP